MNIPALLVTVSALPLMGAVTVGRSEKSPVPAVQAGSPQHGKLTAAVRIGKEWQDHVKSGTLTAGMKLWGYAALKNSTPEKLAKSVEAQTTALGVLKYSELLEDRCVVDFDGKATGESAPASGTYITLRWLSEYAKSYRRESIVIHEPARKSDGLKIIGLRREELPGGKQGAFDLAADLGQLALLKLHAAPQERWEPFLREARAIAEILKVKLPAIPDSVDSSEKESGEKLVHLVMTAAAGVLDPLGAAGGASEARVILNAYALLMLYAPGDETVIRLAALAGAEAEKAKLPGELWKPMVKAVVEKEKAPVIHEAVLTMAVNISTLLGEQQAAADVKTETRGMLEKAFANMAGLPSYKVRAELTTPDKRKAVMDAALALGAMDLTLQGFDGSRQRRLVTEKGFFISNDDGKTWAEDKDKESAIGLLRTLTSPVDPGFKITEKYEFIIAGQETIDDEDLIRVERKDGHPPLIYWVLISKKGPVIRRARLTMKFGEVEADALLVYKGLGKPVEIENAETLKR